MLCPARLFSERAFGAHTKETSFGTGLAGALPLHPAKGDDPLWKPLSLPRFGRHFLFFRNAPQDSRRDHRAAESEGKRTMFRRQAQGATTAPQSRYVQARQLLGAGSACRSRAATTAAWTPGQSALCFGGRHKPLPQRRSVGKFKRGSYGYKLSLLRWCGRGGRGACSFCR